MSDDPILPIPPDALRDEDSFELLRAWVGSGALHCSLRPEVWQDPATWGAVLADLATYAVAAMHEHLGVDPEESLRVIRQRFERELCIRPAPAATAVC